jgi:ABC-type nitrate/sulfonate/bicarbonate transport system permease component
MVVVVTTVNAVASVDVRLVRAAYSLGADSLTIYRAIVCQAIAPHLVAALRVASATGFGLTVAAEYLGAQGGLGFLIRNSRTTLNTESILLAIVLLGIESFIVDFTIRFWGKRNTAWLDSAFEELTQSGDSLNRTQNQTGDNPD